jgi:hypothetical protein
LNQSDSLRADAPRTPPVQSPAFPDALKAFANLGRRRNCLFMLPGFRFLFAAIVLSMSILVFGLGAAALLRAAHEEFASNPSWRATPDAMLAQQAEATRPPVLAMLRVEPPSAQPKATVTSAAEPAAPTEPAAAATAEPQKAAEPEKVAALEPEETAPAKPEIPVPDAPAPSEATAKPADAPASAGAANGPAPALADETNNPASAATDEARSAAPAADERTRVAATEQNPLPANDAGPALSEPASTPASSVNAVSTKIATLGGPTVVIGTPPHAKPVSAKPDDSAIRKRQQARRAAQRRRMAARARQARLATQQQANPFAQPLTQTQAAAPQSH